MCSLSTLLPATTSESTIGSGVNFMLEFGLKVGGISLQLGAF